MKKNFSLYLYVTLFIFTALAISGVFAYKVSQNNSRLVPYEENLSSNEKIKFGLEEIGLQQSRIGIKGWADIAGQKFKCNRTKVVFQNTDNNEKLIIPTYTINVPELEELKEYKTLVGNAEHDAWFVASIKRQKLSPDTTYKILIHFDNCIETGLVDTGKTYSN